jgi:hypothetical protein
MPDEQLFAGVTLVPAGYFCCEAGDHVRARGVELVFEGDQRPAQF